MLVKLHPVLGASDLTLIPMLILCGDDQTQSQRIDEPDAPNARATVPTTSESTRPRVAEANLVQTLGKRVEFQS